MNAGGPRSSLVPSLYSLSVAMYPVAFRAKHAEEMKADFAAEWQRLAENRGRRLRYGGTVLADSFRSLAVEWTMAIPGPMWFSVGFLIALLAFDGLRNQWSTFESAVGFTSTYMGLSIGLRSKRLGTCLLFFAAGVVFSFVGDFFIQSVSGSSGNSPLSPVLQAVRFMLGLVAMLGWMVSLMRNSTWHLQIPGSRPGSRKSPSFGIFCLGAAGLALILLAFMYVDIRVWHNGGRFVETFVVITLSSTFMDLWLGPQRQFIRSKRTDSTGTPSAS